MGSMTLADYRTELKFLLQNRADTAVGDTRLDRWVNQTYAHLTHPSVHGFNELKATFDITLVNGQSEYAFDTLAGYKVLAFRSIHFIDALSGAVLNTSTRWRLHPRPIQWYDERQHPSEAPRHYTVEGTQLMVSPVPGSLQALKVMRCRVWRERPAMTLATDTTLMGDYWDRVLLRGAQAIAEYDLGYRDVAMESLQNYVDMINDHTPQGEVEGSDWGFEVQVEAPPYMGVTS
jgi:hypothetical protein